MSEHYIIKNILIKTNIWLELVTAKDNNIDNVCDLFDKNAILLGTFSKDIRKKDDIQDYFNNFCSIPNLKVVNKKHNIEKISNDVYVNNIYVNWSYDVNQKIDTRMTFIYLKEQKDWKIKLLHSSVLPSPFK